MVAKRDAEAPADVRQLRRADSPLRAGKLHGAGEPRFRRTQPVPGTARVQDAPVERRVVGGDERRVVDPTSQRRPQIGEGWGIMHVLPAQAVESGERKLRAGWTDQVGSGEDYPAAVAGCEADRAGAVAADRSGLEVDRDEGAHWIMRSSDELPPAGSVPLAWAKSPNRRGASSGWLNLVDHSIDVAAVGAELLRLPTIRKRLSALAKRPLSDIDVGRLCFFIGLHDAGKVNHGFQAKLRGQKPDAGHIGPLWSIVGRSHVFKAHRTLCRELRESLASARWRSWFDDRETERDLWAVILAHHGSLPDPPPFDPRLWGRRDGYDPLGALKALAGTMVEMFPSAFEPSHPAQLPTAPRFQHAFAGLVTLADWIGSDETVFRFRSDGAPSGAARVPWAREQAAGVMGRRWFDPTLARDAAMSCAMDFATLFPRHSVARPAQTALLDAPLPRPGQVTVLEAETGSGKTEAALIHFLRLFQTGEVDGLYFALPTRAAAVQIHRRIKAVIKEWLGQAAPPVGLAVPGYLLVDDDEGQRLPDEHGIRWSDDEVRDRAWAVENAKRYLSGMVMVGTIDQVLLGGLRVRHASFRSGPMLRLLLCVDEVHASDAYMTTLLRNVLDQHTVAGGHALLMSATLGSLARLRLLGGRVEAHLEPDAGRAAALFYPSLQRSGEDLQPLPCADGELPEKRVTVELVDPEADADPLVAQIKAVADSGAAVLFIRNRVGDARDTVLRLERIGAPLLRCQGVQAPHHGRFAPEDRRLLDAALEEAFGMDGTRKGVVAVTTQTAEQSLDIDADWLVTDAAPGDVLLQRIGRLHRHPRTRPPACKTPRVTVLAPTPEQLAAALDSVGGIARGRTLLGLGRVYENIVGVLSTLAWLSERGEVRIPADNRKLVEAATNRAELTAFACKLGDRWSAHLQVVEGKTAAAGGTARMVSIDWEAPLVENQPGPPDERAKTRLGLTDRRVDLPSPLLGPFGRPVRTLNIPGWMVEAEPEDAVVTEASGGGGIRFRFGTKIFRYDRLGLSIATE